MKTLVKNNVQVLLRKMSHNSFSLKFGFKNISLSYSKYNVQLYLRIQTCYLNKKLLSGGITLFLIYVYCSTSNPALESVHKDNIVMFSVSN